MVKCSNDIFLAFSKCFFFNGHVSLYSTQRNVYFHAAIFNLTKDSVLKYIRMFLYAVLPALLCISLCKYSKTIINCNSDWLSCMHLTRRSEIYQAINRASLLFMSALFKFIAVKKNTLNYHVILFSLLARWSGDHFHSKTAFKTSRLPGRCSLHLALGKNPEKVRNGRLYIHQTTHTLLICLKNLNASTIYLITFTHHVFV